MPETPDPREQAADKRRAREQRIHDLRMRVAAIAVAVFVVVWGGLYIQLVSGHDPALASAAAAVATQSADPEATTSDTSGDGFGDGSTGSSDDALADDGSDDAWSDDGTSTATGESTRSTSSSAPAAVSTGQS
jgi:hypothetical protein